MNFDEYESVYPVHWLDHNYDYEESETYRRAQADQFINDITTEAEERWSIFLNRCAGTNSNDLATFPVFAEFPR